MQRDTREPKPSGGTIRALGLGFATGAVDDDPSAIGTYSSAGATFGTALLWTARVTFPMLSTPPLLLLIMLMTNNRQIMGEHVNSRWLTVLGWTTTLPFF